MTSNFHIKSKYVLLLISVLSLVIFSNSQNIVLNYVYCSNPVNSTESNNFKSNLNDLLTSVSSKSTSNTFHSDSSNGIYALYLCRGDVSEPTCRDCVNEASTTIQERCNSNKTGIIWYDQCMLRYSNSNFVGEVQTRPYILMYNTGTNNVSQGEQNYGALGLIYKLIDRVRRETDLFETGTDTVGDGSSRYALVQCSRDLNSSACESCLGQLSQEGESCCPRQRGWRILAPSCSMRYEESLFYEEPPSPPTPTPSTEVPSAPQPGLDTGKDGNENVVIIAVTSCVVVLAVISGFLYYICCFRKKRRHREGETSQVILLGNGVTASRTNRKEGEEEVFDHDNDGEVQCFNLVTIRNATKGFSDENKLGEGGFGPVYKGKLPDGQEIAVKRLSMTSKQGLEEFRNEVKVIIKLQHKNLVKLFGYCLDGDEKLLVYEYLANTSLDAFLFDSKKCKELDWTRRENIITGTAKGLQYLHEDSRLKIIHRDLKASNILLDDDMNPKISDFGTARIFGGNQIEANTDRVVGTYGYMAPEYALEGVISIKSDVYSFGILMLEIISGQKNRGFYNPEHGQSLLLHAWQLWSKGKGEELIDKTVLDNCPKTKVLRWIHIALLCVQDDHEMRPMMSTVNIMLGSKAVNLPQLVSAPHSAIRFATMSDISTTSGAGSGTDLLEKSTTIDSR